MTGRVGKIGRGPRGGGDVSGPARVVLGLHHLRVREVGAVKLFDRTILLLERVLDLRAAWHQVIASNIANEETPGYRAKELPFREALAAAARGELAGRLLVTHSRHLRPGEGGASPGAVRLADASAGATGLDANTVNLEVEMAKLTDNAMQYNAAAAIVAMRFQQLLAVIREAR